MKPEASPKYPHSASLFQFCRKVLDHKFGGIRVIDQDVGQILGFDPADCSHWKRGKKNIRSIQAMKSIAEHLGVDEKLVVDIASGEVNDLEAFYEYAGYGGLSVNKDLMETAKKDFYKKNTNTWTREKDLEFRDFFNLNEDLIDKIVESIHTQIDFSEAPLYLPEIAAGYATLSLSPKEGITEPMVTKDEANNTLIAFPADEKMRPYIRFQIAKAMAPYFFDLENMKIPTELGSHGEHVMDIQSNIFAAKLLTPAALIRKELRSVDTAKDVVTQLAEIFWVSKLFMNKRLKTILEKNPKI